MRDIIRRILVEDSSQDKMKERMFKFWDREKSMGKDPSVNSALAKSMGYYNTSILYLWLVDWYGGEEKVYEVLESEIDGKTFSTDDLEEMGIDVGSYDFIFKLSNMEKTQLFSGGVKIDIDLRILDGGVTLFTDGVYLDLTRIDDYRADRKLEVILWEVSGEIEDIIKSMIYKKSNPYGYSELIDHIEIHFK
jgi:hypothetical protein